MDSTKLNLESIVRSSVEASVSEMLNQEIENIKIKIHQKIFESSQKIVFDVMKQLDYRINGTDIVIHIKTEPN